MIARRIRRKGRLGIGVGRSPRRQTHIVAASRRRRSSTGFSAYCREHRSVRGGPAAIEQRGNFHAEHAQSLYAVAVSSSELFLEIFLNHLPCFWRKGRKT